MDNSIKRRNLGIILDKLLRKPYIGFMQDLNCTDLLRFMPEELRIWDKLGNLVPLKANRVQADYLANRTRRNIVLKPRQCGLSTAEQSSNYFDVTRRHEGQRAWLVAHKDETSRSLLERARDFYTYQAEDAKPTVKNFNEREMTFPSMGASYRIATAGGESVGVGVTITRLHVSELPFWPGDPERLYKGMAAAVPATGEITIESTPGARGDYFHSLWQAAKAGRNEFRCFFYPWWWTEEYTMEKDDRLALPGDRFDPLAYTDEEVVLVKKHGLKSGQIRWRRWAKQHWKSEFPRMYPEDDVSCFLHAGRPRFNQQILEEMLQQAPKPARTLEDGAIRIYLEPSPAHFYAVSGDPSEGLSISSQDTDDSAFHIIDLHTMRMAVAGNGKWEPRHFARVLNDWGRRYFNAYLGVERNNQGHAVLGALEHELYYPNLYYPPEEFIASTMRPGWRTTASNKYLALAELDDALSSRELMVPDVPTLDQLMGFQRLPDGTVGAPKGEHDDLVSSLMILYQMRKYAPIHKAAEPVRFSAAARGLVGV